MTLREMSMSKIANDPLLRNLMNVHLFAFDEILAIFYRIILNHRGLDIKFILFPRLLECMESTAGRLRISSFCRCLFNIIQIFRYFLIPHQSLFTRPWSFSLFAHRLHSVDCEDSRYLSLHDELLGVVQIF
jgi:hypothetical protein